MLKLWCEFFLCVFGFVVVGVVDDLSFDCVGGDVFEKVWCEN